MERLNVLEGQVKQHEARLLEHDKSIAAIQAVQERTLKHDQEWREEQKDAVRSLQELFLDRLELLSTRMVAGFKEIHAELAIQKASRKGKVVTIWVAGVVAIVGIVAAVATGTFDDLIGAVVHVVQAGEE